MCAAVTSFESPTDPPNYRLRELETEKTLALTHFDDPQPALRKIEHKLVTYKRRDGVELSATLYYPKDRADGERLRRACEESVVQLVDVELVLEHRAQTRARDQLAAGAEGAPGDQDAGELPRQSRHVALLPVGAVFG